MRRLAAIVGGLLVSSAFASEGPARLVEDIRKVPLQDEFLGLSGIPSGFAGFGGVVYFQAYQEGSLGGLWRTDGTEAGTQLIEDGVGGLGFGRSAALGGSVFFPGAVGLWRTDGTPEGTDAVPLTGPPFTALSVFVPFGAGFLFRATDAAHGTELWWSDGTPAGTRLVKDIRTGSFSSGPQSAEFVPVRLGEIVLFCADDGVHGAEIWISDGSEDGTSLLRDINPGVASSCTDPGNGQRFVRVGEAVYFFADDGLHGRELWRSDGTPEGTALLQELAPGPEGPGHAGVVALGDLLLFFERGSNGVANALWRSNGTPEGTVRVKELTSAFRLVPAQGQAFFSVGSQLWRTDGTEEGTFAVKTFAPGPINSVTALGGGGVLFTVNDGVHGTELWRSNGTEAGTSLIRDIRPGADDSRPDSLTAVGGVAYFAADDGAVGRELWKSDGTEEGTVLVKDIGAVRGSRPTMLTDLSGTLMFTAIDDAHGPELWRSDGTEAGTTLVTEMLAGTEDYAWYGLNPFDWLTPLGGKLFFGVLDTETFDYSPAVSDGTGAGTGTLADSMAYGVTPVGNGVLFQGFDPVHGYEPWWSDGTAAGTGMLRDISTSPYMTSYFPPDGGLGDVAVFMTQHFQGESRNYLWRTDGTPEGTVQIRELYPQSGQTGFGVGFLRAGDAVYFTAGFQGNPSGHDLWRTDGTEPGTFTLAGAQGLLGDVFNQAHFAAVGDTLFASVWNDALRGRVLWRTSDDGTAIVKVKDLVGTDRYSLLVDVFAGAGDLLFLSVSTLEHGAELWTSDGTGEGTALLRDICPGPCASRPQAFAAVDGVLLFTASDGVQGSELWRSDGTAEGTVQVQDLFPGPGSSMPHGFRRSGARVYFSAVDAEHGEELWSGFAAIVTGQPARAIDDLRGMVVALGLPPGLENGLLAKLNAAGAALAAGDPSGAIGPLRGVTSVLRGWRGRHVPVEAADELMDLAGQTITLLGGQSRPQPGQRIEGQPPAAGPTQLAPRR